VIYTTNAIESLNMSLRKVIKTRGSFRNQEAALKLLFLALEHIAKKWTMPVQNWKAALQRFAILLGDRVPQDAIRPGSALRPFQACDSCSALLHRCPRSS
jgi:putative transposase